MKFLDELRSRVPPRIQANGSTYHARALVRIEEDTPRRCAAVVKGSRDYAATIERRGDELSWNCDCVSFEDYGQCKHVWALALTAAAGDAAIVTGVARSTPSRRGGARTKPESKAAVRPRARLVYQLIADRDPARPRIEIAVQRQELTASGEYRVGRQLRIFGEDDPEVQASVDRRLLTALHRLNGAYEAGLRMPERCAAGGQKLAALLDDLAACGRVAWVDHRGRPLDAVVAKDTVYRLRIALDEDPVSRRTVFRVGLVAPNGDFLPLTSAHGLSAAGLAFVDGTLARLDNTGGIAFAHELFERFRATAKGIEIEPAEALRALGRIAAATTFFAVELPPRLREATTPERILEILPPDPALKSLLALQVRLRFRYGSETVDFETPAPLLRGPPPRWIVRDRDLELASRREFEELGGEMTAPAGERPRAFLRIEDFPRAVKALKERGYLLHSVGAKVRFLSRARARIRSGIDWFDLELVTDFEGGRPALPDLLAAVRAKSRTVPLDDGTIGILPEEWLGRWGLLELLAQNADGSFRVPRAQAWLLDAALETLPEAEPDADFAKLRSRLGERGKLAPEPEPPGFRGTLRPYQRESLAWFRFLRDLGTGGCLADDMGLGKTVQVLAMLVARRNEREAPAPSLVVAPRSLVFNWKSEAARFAPGLRVADLSGSAPERAAIDLSAIDLAITTYGVLRNDAETLAAVAFDCVVLDESGAIKNASSLTARAARALSARHRIALSGTPIENHLGELRSLFEFLAPGLLGRSTVFKNAAGDDGGLDADPEARALLGRALRPFILRRTKEDVAPELPEKTEQILECDLEGDQRADYDALAAHYRAALLGEVKSRGLNTMSLQVLEALLRLRQTACHPALVDAGRAEHGSAKLEVLVERLRELLEGGHRALVFSQFTGFLDLVETRLRKEGIAFERLDGRTRDREARVDRFQSDSGPGVFLISLKAGGVGLNLTAADYVFILDPWWNPAAEAQAAGRAHRIGQVRPVVVYRLVAKDTIEEKILALQAKKTALVDSILDAGATTLSDLSADDLALLLA